MNSADIKVLMERVSAYEGNQLIDACGPILSSTEIGRRLIHFPVMSEFHANAPAHILEHELAALWRLHIPTSTGISVAQTLDVMQRQGYVHRKPTDPATWRRLYGQSDDDHSLAPIQLAAAVGGISGTGKTSAVERALRLKPQVQLHHHFPGLVGEVRQLLWVKIDVPGSGKTVDLVESLVRACDVALGTRYSYQILDGRRRSGASLAHEWIAMIGCHFLGMVVLDEIQNLFKIQTKLARTSSSRRGDDRPELRIVDDEALKFLLTLTNTSKIPLVICGTPEGIDAFSNRMSTSQRLATGGVHTVPHAATPDDKFYMTRLFPQLVKYQWLPELLPPSDELRALLHNLSGGVLRICIALWIHAHRRAFARRGKGLKLDDFRQAATNELAMLRPAVMALLSNDPRRLQLYQDLLPNGAFS